jgi:hypothetical protein
MADGITHIPEVKGPGLGRLGRNIDRSDRFWARHVTADRVSAVPTSMVQWTRHCPPFDQAQLGSCTGNAGTGALMTDPLWQKGWSFGEPDAIQLYGQASQFNPAGEQYPPHDDGSSGNCVADALEKDGTVSTSQHATDLQTMLGMLAQGPVILGIHWYTSFDTPNADGECPLSPGATVRGGHEIEAFKVDPIKQQVWCYQSWGPTWGGLKDGTFWFSYATLNKLFEQQGDATSFTLAANPTNPFVGAK